MGIILFLFKNEKVAIWRDTRAHESLEKFGPEEDRAPVEDDEEEGSIDNQDDGSRRWKDW